MTQLERLSSTIRFNSPIISNSSWGVMVAMIEALSDGVDDSTSNNFWTMALIRFGDLFWRTFPRSSQSLEHEGKPFVLINWKSLSCSSTCHSEELIFFKNVGMSPIISGKPTMIIVKIDMKYVKWTLFFLLKSRRNDFALVMKYYVDCWKLMQNS